MNIRILSLAFLCATSSLLQAGPIDWTKKKISDHPFLATIAISATSIGIYRTMTADTTTPHAQTEKNTNELDNHSPTIDPLEEEHRRFYSIDTDESKNGNKPQMHINNLDTYKDFIGHRKPRTSTQPTQQKHLEPSTRETPKKDASIFVFEKDSIPKTTFNAEAVPVKSCLKKTL